MNRRLPPLNALRAFEVAARTTNFTLAAQELHVSQGAVSRHVAQLEAYLGTRLFHREHRDVRLTAEGAKYAQAIRVAFDQMDAATRGLTQGCRHRPLRIKLFPTLAAIWFVPRLARFHAQHRDIDLQITTTSRQVRFDAEDVDFTVQVQYISQPGVRYDKLFDVELLPVCSSSFLGRIPNLRTPENLLQQTLLHSMRRPNDWRTWFESVGVKPVAINDGLTFGNSALACQAAVEGSGIAIIHRPLVCEALSSGRLVPAFEPSVMTGETYYLVGRNTLEADPRATAFRAWVLAEALETQRRMSALPSDMNGNEGFLP
jgi:LysR family transcriptional regulator, glycine cleavage system transcriptional activator